jgi:hypothetical protein
MFEKNPIPRRNIAARKKIVVLLDIKCLVDIDLKIIKRELSTFVSFSKKNAILIR